MRVMSEVCCICPLWLRGGNTHIMWVIRGLSDINLRYKSCFVGCSVQSSLSDRHIDRVYL